jgi:hypothetical protein
MWVPLFKDPRYEDWSDFPYQESWGVEVPHSGYVGSLEQGEPEPRRRIGFDLDRFIDDHEPFPLVRQRTRLLPCPSS